MQRVLGSRQCFLTGLGDAEHIQQDGIKQGPPSGVQKKTNIEPRILKNANDVWENTTILEQSNMLYNIQQQKKKISIQTTQQAKIFWRRWWSTLLVTADKFSPSYSLHEPEYFIGVLYFPHFHLNRLCIRCSAGDQAGVHAAGRGLVVNNIWKKPGGHIALGQH